MLAVGYLPHALYSVAITSISIHLVNQRRISSDERARTEAQITILQSISQQLQSDKPLSNAGLQRLRRLARPPKDGEDSPESDLKDAISWKEVVLGRKRSENAEVSEWDKRDMEKGIVTLSCSRVHV